MSNWILKHCPFCGGKAEMQAHCTEPQYNEGLPGFILCTECGAAPFVQDISKARQIHLWNTRAPDPALAAKDATIAELREALKKIDAEDDTGPLVFEADENGRMRASHNAKGRFAEIARAALEATR